MKTIGLIGGTGWISSVDYYRIINEETNRRLGNMNFAKIILYSLNYGDVETLQKNRDFEGLFNLLLDSARKVISIGADCVLLGANTMHLHADRLEKEISVPLIHIAEATARAINQKNIPKVGLLGTKTTMEKDFYKTKLNKAGIEVVVPQPDDRKFIHTVIVNELLKGKFLKESKDRFLEIIQGLQMEGARGVVLGCTEIPLLIKQEDLELPVFNTTRIHSEAAVSFSLQD